MRCPTQTLKHLGPSLRHIARDVRRPSSRALRSSHNRFIAPISSLRIPRKPEWIPGARAVPTSGLTLQRSRPRLCVVLEIGWADGQNTRSMVDAGGHAVDSNLSFCLSGRPGAASSFVTNTIDEVSSIAYAFFTTILFRRANTALQLTHVPPTLRPQMSYKQVLSLSTA